MYGSYIRNYSDEHRSIWDSMTVTQSLWKFRACSFPPSSCSDEFWKLTVDGGYCRASLVAVLFIVVWHLSRRLLLHSAPGASDVHGGVSVPSSVDSGPRIPEVVTDEDLKGLIRNLDENVNVNEEWEHVIGRRNDLLSYQAKCCRPKDGPLKYRSVTVFENCFPQLLRDFYMDNDYRKQWDKTVVEHEQLQVDMASGIEIGRTIKKFPLLMPREYVLAWRLWKTRDGAFYCFTKECEHHLAPYQRKYVRVSYFRSGWRIRKVPGRDACEIKMFHQEDAGLNVEMAKLVFSKGIWSYVRKMDNALRRYTPLSHQQMRTGGSALSLIRKVPPELDSVTSTTPEASYAAQGLHSGKVKEKRLLRKPSRKLLTNGLILLGGAICLSRGHSALGAKVAMAFFLTKLSKRGTSTSQGRRNSGAS